MSSQPYGRYPASSSAPPPRHNPYQPGPYPPQSSSSTYVPPPPPPPPTPPVNFSQSSQYPPPPQDDLHSVASSPGYRGGPRVFDRLNFRRQPSVHHPSPQNPPPIQTSTTSGVPSGYPQQPKSADPYNQQRGQYQHRPISLSSGSSVSSSVSSNSSHSSTSRRQQQGLPDISRLRFEEPQQQRRLSSRKRNNGPKRIGVPQRPPGYKSPSVESVPPSPASFATLSPDSKHVLDEDEGYFSTLSAEVKARLRNEPLPDDYKPEPILEQAPPPKDSKPINKATEFIKPTLVKSDSWRTHPLQYFEHSDSSSDPDSPGNETSTRKSRPYAISNNSPPPPAVPPIVRQPRPYSIISDTSEPVIPEPRAPQEHRGSQDSRAPPEHRASQDSRTPLEYRAPQEYRAPPEHRIPQESRAPPEHRVPQEPRVPPEPRAPRPYALKSETPKPEPTPPAAREPRPYTHSPNPQTRYQPPPLESQAPPRPSPQPRFRQTPPPPSPVQQTQLRPPPKRDLAPPIELLPTCPKKTLVHWNRWFQIPSIPNFDICISCYYIHIHPSPFFAHFIPSDKPYGENASCHFNTDRILQKVWPHVLQTGNFNSLRDYAAMRSMIPPCNGVEGTSVGGPSAKRWKVYDGSIPKFRCCDACYNDIVLATAFAGCFSQVHAVPEDKVWTCDLAIPFIAGGMLQLSKYQDQTGQDQWDQFRNIALYRLNEVSPCPGKTPVKSSGKNWWVPKDPIPGLTVCDACYCDDIVPHFKDQFIQAVIPAAQSSSLLTCAMSNFNIKGPWALAVERGQYAVWWEAARAVFDLPPCTAKGFPDHAVGGEWYTLQHHDPCLENFKCCRTCYFTLIRPLNLAQYFQHVIYVNNSDPSSPSYNNSTVVRVCSLTPESPRFLPLLEKLGEAANWKDFGLFLSYIIPRAAIPPCQPGKFLARAKWYGTDDFVVCEECWFEHVRESPLAHFMTVHARFSPEPQACDLYSPRMKKIWEEACHMRDLHHFVNAAVERGKIYCDILERSKEINDLIAARKRVGGPRYPNAMVRVGEDGQSYGGSSRHDNNGVDAVTADLYKRLDSLQKEWKSVE